jgi:hypothetical protein
MNFGKKRTIKGIPRGVSLNHISSLQLKENATKGCEIYVVHINSILEKMVDHLLTIYQYFMWKPIKGQNPKYFLLLQ